MGVVLQTEFSGFPVITFRKKRLTVTIHACFNLEHADDVAVVKQTVEDAMRQLTKHGQAKNTFSVAEI
jgi:G:T-mismatch repair DNA endonuclease (very short patch repair protein)